MTLHHEPTLSDRVVVLVHGTFAREADWIEPQSTFASHVRSCYGSGTIVVPFRWNGKNSHAHRLRAGVRLAEKLKLLAREHPNASLTIIAHSHGGNVVLYALNATNSFHGRITHVVCLATPFIICEAREVGRTIQFLTNVALVTIFAPVALLIWALPLDLISIVIDTVIDEVFRPPVGDEWSATMALTVVGVQLALVFTRWLWLLLNGCRRWLERRVQAWSKQRQEAVTTAVSVRGPRGVRCLAVRARGDEAALYLNALDWIANLPYFLWSPGLARVIGGMTALYIGSLAAFLSWQAYQPNPELGGGFAAVAFVLFMVMPIYAVAPVAVFLGLLILFQVWLVLWPKVFRGHALGFGESGLVQNMLVRIRATGALAGWERRSFVARGRGLRHSQVYEDRNIVEAVGHWLTR